jgi:hypothetical protein
MDTGLEPSLRAKPIVQNHGFIIFSPFFIPVREFFLYLE